MNGWLVFLDESGVLMAPVLRRTWSPCGQTPQVRHRTRHHQKVSVVAALCLSPSRLHLRLYFRLHVNTNIRGPEVAGFLRHLLRELPGPIVLLWDRLNAHRAASTQQFLNRRPRLHPVFFPSYAPELNPTEFFWAYLKANPLANAAFLDLPTLAAATRHHGRRIQRLQALLRSFIKHSALPLRLR